MTISAQPRQKSISGIRFRFISAPAWDIITGLTVHPRRTDSRWVKARRNPRELQWGPKFTANVGVIFLADNFSKEGEPGPDAAINDKRKKSPWSHPRLLHGREHKKRAAPRPAGNSISPILAQIGWHPRSLQ